MQLLLAGDSFYPNVCHLDGLPAGCPSGSWARILFCSWVEPGAHTPSCTRAPKHGIFSPSWAAAVAGQLHPQSWGVIHPPVPGPSLRAAWHGHHPAEIPALHGRKMKGQISNCSPGSRRSGPVSPASSSVDPTPDTKVNLISLHRQSKLSG